MGNAAFEMAVTQRSVNLWSDQRLPFEPKGAIREGRDRLRQALHGLQADEGDVLVATYHSAVDSFCDAENVLIYNVGPSAMRHLTLAGLAFNRRWQRPEPAPSGQRFSHQNAYRLMKPAQLAPFSDSVAVLTVPWAGSAAPQVHEVWWATAGAQVTGWQPIGGPFWLEVVIARSAPTPALPSLVKPLLDGVVSGLHRGVDIEPEALGRLASKMGQAPDEVARRLSSPSAPVLGDRQVLRAYRDSLKWDPADDLCERCLVRLAPGRTPKVTVTVGAIS